MLIKSNGIWSIFFYNIQLIKTLCSTLGFSESLTTCTYKSSSEHFISAC